MMPRVRWTADGTADLQEHLEYIVERNPGAAARLPERVLVAEQTIRQWPKAAPFDDELGIYER